MNGFSPGVALVAGGTGGLGRAICEAFAAAGSPVAFTYLANAAGAAALAARFGTAIQLDLRDEPAVEAALEQVAARHGGIHSVIYAAGPSREPQFVSRMGGKAWLALMEDDFLPCAHLLHAALPHLRATRGSFTTLATYQAARAKPTGAWTAVPKAAIERLMVHAAKEEGRYGVRANAVRVGITDAGLGRRRVDDPFFQEMIRRETALGRPGTAAEVAEAVLFLASPRASLITGAMLPADGGHGL